MQKNTLFLLLAVLLAFLAISQQFRLRSLRHSLNAMQAEREAQRIRIQADEAFLAGDTATAFRLYAGLSDSLLQLRMESRPAFQAGSKSAAPLPKTPSSANSRPANQTAAQLEEIIDSLNQVIIHEREEAAQTLPPIPPQPVAMDFRTKEFLQFPTAKKGETVNYLGEIKNGKANGKGVAVWKNGSAYQGEWSDNLRHGQGTFSWADGEKYIGAYKNDLRQGWGIYITKNGERYEGGWEQDKREGPGRLYDKTGNLKLEGVWKSDKLIKTVKSY